MSNYKQYDTRWAKLAYPRKPWTIGYCGCGEVAICNCITKTAKYRDATPKTIQPYCKQFAEPHGNGTYFSGIPKMLAHYGFSEVKEHQTMNSLWKELSKGKRVAIYLMGNRKGGSKGVHWTGSAHFVCSTAFKVENGKHYVYVKDSNSTSKLRNGWVSYEENLRGDVSRVWSGKLPKTFADKIMQACKDQAEYMKNYVYGWQSRPTIEKSKKKGTCVTYVACVLQRTGLLPAGKYIWHDEKGKVVGATKDMTVAYCSKTLKEYKNRLEKGDIVITGSKSDTAGGSHIFIVTGKWNGNNPYIWDNHSAERIKAGKSGAHTYNGNKKVIAIVKAR